MSEASRSIAVIGGGAWGTALANAAGSAGNAVILFARDPQAAQAMQTDRENARYLPGIRLHDAVRATADLADIASAEAVLLVTPAQTTRAVVEGLAGVVAPDAPLVLCSKGIERESGRFLSDVIADVRPGSPVAVLSGPSFAVDVARGLPTAVTLACADLALAAELAGMLSGRVLRVYHTSDVRGVEIGGAAKNVLAIACGAAIGRGLGESAKAALIARGFAELVRFARAYGAQPETLMGLSGLGDLVLTCGSPQSRNFAFGQRLGGGASVSEASGGKLAEGVHTASVLVSLGREAGIEMPIAEAVDALTAGRITVDEAMDALMNRPLRAEG
jgi:glycerol-3-phosphate dehydrogenase (NAD(P)+)